MTNRQKNGIGCLVIAALLAGVAIKNSLITPVIAAGDESGLSVSRLVGAFLPSILVFALGLWLVQKPKSRLPKKTEFERLMILTYWPVTIVDAIIVMGFADLQNLDRTAHSMNPKDLILWACFAGMAWILFASITGADEWLKSLFGNSKLNDLEKRVLEMERRMETMERN